jgi:hypothetical protein
MEEKAYEILGTIRFHMTGHVLIRVSVNVQSPQNKRVGGGREQARVKRDDLIVERSDEHHLDL